MENEKDTSRRDFLKTGLLFSAVATGSLLVQKPRSLLAQQAGGGSPDLVAVRNGEPDRMFDKAIAAYGGMGEFVRRGNTVVVKPNIAWNSEPEGGANTNPVLVKRIIEHCFDAGARKVYVFDHPVSYWKNTYSSSGIEKAAKSAGALVVPAHSNSYYQKVRVPGGRVLKEVEVHELILEADVFINVPVLKHHSSTRLTMAMKNLMGAVWDRGYYHRNGLHQCIADFCLFRKPDLNVLDAYRVMLRHGPGYAGPSDIQLRKNLLLSRDIVAIDTAGAKLHDDDPNDIGYIRYGESQNIGTTRLERLTIERIVL